MCVYICIYIYIYRERDIIYIYIYIYIYYIILEGRLEGGPLAEIAKGPHELRVEAICRTISYNVWCIITETLICVGCSMSDTSVLLVYTVLLDENICV